MVRSVRDMFGKNPGRSRVSDLLADLPFAGYITTNYDDILIRALRRANADWAQVGNTSDELKMLSGARDRVVWHLHGSATMPQAKSNLVITETDYDHTYDDGSPALEFLRSFLLQKQLVFIGFGFADWELMRVLRSVGRLTNPARPIYAFLPSSAGGAELWMEMRERSNIDVLPYRRSGDSHQGLSELLEGYGGLILRRSLQFGRAARECPDYDPEATGLLIYNELALGSLGVQENVLKAILKGLVMAMLEASEESQVRSIEADMRAKLSALASSPSTRIHAQTLDLIRDVFSDLEAAGLVEIDDLAGTMTLTPLGIDLVERQSSSARLHATRFRQALETRADALLPSDASRAQAVAKVAEAFLKQCVERRALGVAMVEIVKSAQRQDFHVTGLLQALPEFLTTLTTVEEALALGRLIRELLSSPVEAERLYIGITLQARFGVNLLSCDPDTLAARQRDFMNTVFVLDSSLLIQYFANGSVGHDVATQLLGKLRDLDATLCTTTLLAGEVHLHLKWASSHVGADGQPNLQTLRTAMGLDGLRQNAFIDGYLASPVTGQIRRTFWDYLKGCLGPTGGMPRSFGAVRESLNKHKVGVRNLSTTESTKQTNSTIMALARTIGDQRKSVRTYTGERQVIAEAQVFQFLKNIREKGYEADGRKYQNAFFLAHSRVMNEVEHGNVVCLSPDAALQWALTLSPSQEADLGVLTSCLQWELSEQGLDVVDEARLNLAFQPFVSAPREALEEELARHHDRIEQRYGVDAAAQFAAADDVNQALIWESVNAQRLEALERQVKAQDRQLGAAKRIATLSVAEREEYERLKAAADARSRKAKTRRRAAESRGGRPKRKTKGK
jgi:hypothetical protein